MYHEIIGVYYSAYVVVLKHRVGSRHLASVWGHHCTDATASIRCPGRLSLIFTMPDLKRKRKDEEGLEDHDSAAAATTHSDAGDSTSPSRDDPSAVKKSSDGDAVVTPKDNDTSGHPARAGGPSTITICGKEVVLKGTAGRKKRKYDRDALILMAYKGHLARMCKADNMVSALEIYREMKSKKIVPDLEVSTLSSVGSRSPLICFRKAMHHRDPSGLLYM